MSRITKKQTRSRNRSIQDNEEDTKNKEAAQGRHDEQSNRGKSVIFSGDLGTIEEKTQAFSAEYDKQETGAKQSNTPLKPEHGEIRLGRTSQVSSMSEVPSERGKSETAIFYPLERTHPQSQPKLPSVRYVNPGYQQPPMYVQQVPSERTPDAFAHNVLELPPSASLNSRVQQPYQWYTESRNAPPFAALPVYQQVPYQMVQSVPNVQPHQHIVGIPFAPPYVGNFVIEHTSPSQPIQSFQPPVLPNPITASPPHLQQVPPVMGAPAMHPGEHGELLAPPGTLQIPMPSSSQRITKEPRNRCPVCHKVFRRPSSLQIHLVTHTGERMYVCPWEGCNRSFSVKSNMKRHYKLHERNAAQNKSKLESSEPS